MEVKALSDAVHEAANSLAEVSLEDLQAKHRKERKELQAKVQSLKKNAPKSDKKKRKDALEEITKLESDLEAKQAEELNEAMKTLNNGDTASHDKTKDSTNDNKASNHTNGAANASDDDNDGDDVVRMKQPQRISKAQRRRDKKTREARQREQDIKAASEDAMFAPKAVEARKILSKLKSRNLALHNVLSDGDCLYNAIRHQLMQQGLGAHTVQSLRYETANYIHANKESLIPYMTNPDTGDLLNDDEFEKYCDDVRNTPAWGGQIELKALSSILKVPIEVVQADGSPTIQGADEFAGPPLVITYHRLMYSLGEHYNSTIFMPEEELEGELSDGN